MHRRCRMICLRFQLELGASQKRLSQARVFRGCTFRSEMISERARRWRRTSVCYEWREANDCPMEINGLSWARPRASVWWTEAQYSVPDIFHALFPLSRIGANKSVHLSLPSPPKNRALPVTMYMYDTCNSGPLKRKTRPRPFGDCT